MASSSIADIDDELIEGDSVPDEGMDELELASILGQLEAQAIGYFEDDIAEEQEQALNYYYRRMPDLPAAPGTSSVVDGTVAIVIDNAMASILKPFVSADDTVSFSPRGPEDEEQAAQATEYVNFVFNSDNPGFMILHNWFKDALLQKLGVIKIYWDDYENVDREEVAPQNDIELAMLRQRPDYLDEYETPDGVMVVLETREKDGRVKIENVPPEEFEISPYSRTIQDSDYVAHSPKNVTRSDLIEMGFDEEIVETLPRYTGDGNEEGRRQARYQDEDFAAGYESKPHESQDIIGIRDEYVKIDFDGDGIAELRRIIRVDSTILLNEEVDDNPFAALCPVPMAHKVHGLSLADQTVDLQRISTVLWRQTLDNLYKSNNPRPVLPEGSERDDGTTGDSLVDAAPGAAIFEGQKQIRFESVPFTADKSFPMLEYTEQQQEARTGIARSGQGMNANAITKSGNITDYQRAMMEGGKNARPEMIARIFAETGVRRAFKLILGLVTKFQDKKRLIRLRNDWVEIDPQGWSPDMDLEISVGLGLGEKSDQINQADSILETMAELAQSPFANLIDRKKVYNAVKRKFTAAGVKNIDDFLIEPEEDEEGALSQEGPSPEEQAVQAEMMMQQAKLQGEQQLAAARLQGEQQIAELKLEMQEKEAALKIQLAQDKAAAEAQLARDKAEFEAEMAIEKLAMKKELAKQKAVDLPDNRPGGDLDK